jgi:hypothetical protein
MAGWEDREDLEDGGDGEDSGEKEMRGKLAVARLFVRGPGDDYRGSYFSEKSDFSGTPCRSGSLPGTDGRHRTEF